MFGYAFGIPRSRRATSTSNFGVSRREAHDASGFYRRFRPPEISRDSEVLAAEPIAEPFVCGDARKMDEVAEGSVALVVTSPPYFAGKQYEEELERDGVPSSYLEYLELLTDVFAECVRKLEPGGRIAVNVANLGRKPYRSLSSDVIRILEHDLGLLLRGELVWQKGEGASGSCAWGSYRSAANPVLRDVTERIIVASKGRFDRALKVRQREERGLPHESTILPEDFMASTLDVWSIPPESAQRVGHPAPFPVELPAQLIRLYTYVDDLVLDPFMGSGSALVAAARLGRRYIGYDTDPAYVEVARARVTEALEAPDDPPALAEADSTALQLAERCLAGFTVTGRQQRVRRSGVRVPFVVADTAGATWHVDVAGPLTSTRGGMARADVAWRTLGRASAVRGRAPNVPFVVLTSQPPPRGSEADTALRAAGPGLLFDVIDMTSPAALARLAHYAAGGAREPEPGFWTARDLGSSR